MRTRYSTDFQREVVKTARKHCKIEKACSPNPVYWQFNYKGKTYNTLLDIYEKLVADGNMEKLPESVIDADMDVSEEKHDSYYRIF